MSIILQKGIALGFLAAFIFGCMRGDQGCRESLRGPGQNICSDCFNRVFDCSIRVYRSFGAHKQSGGQGKTPLLPPLSAALVVMHGSVTNLTLFSMNL